MVAVISVGRRGHIAPPAAFAPSRRCLVVSADPVLRRQVTAAAAAAGWSCSAPTAAAAFAAVEPGFHVVFIDLVRPPFGLVPTDLAAEFAADPDTQVVACGAADRPEEEIQLRMLGVDVYVPGVAPGSGLRSLVRSICR